MHIRQFAKYYYYEKNIFLFCICIALTFNEFSDKIFS